MFDRNFLMALSPAVFEGSIYYGITTVVMLTMTIASVTILFYSLITKVLKAPCWLALYTSFITSFWMIESIHSPVNGLFWFNGSVHYVFMHGSMLFVIGNMLLYYVACRDGQRKTLKALWIIFASFFAYLCGGANYSTALLTGCITTLLVIAIIYLTKKATIIIPYVFFGTSFVINVLAPGNKVRGDNFNGLGPVRAIVESYKLAFVDELKWLDLQAVLIVLLLLPVLYMVAERISEKIRWWMPVLSILLAVSLHAAMNIPLFFAMGGGGLDRQENICKFWFQLTLVINVLLIICCLRPYIDRFASTIKKSLDENGVKRILVITGIYYLIIFMAIAGQIKLSDRRLHQYSSLAAYVSVRSGEAADFYATYEERLSVVEGNTGDIVVSEYRVNPYLLYFDDITEEPADWRNAAWARWYGVNSVRKE